MNCLNWLVSGNADGFQPCSVYLSATFWQLIFLLRPLQGLNMSDQRYESKLQTLRGAKEQIVTQLVKKFSHCMQLEFHYRVHQTAPLYLIHSHSNPVHVLPTYLFKAHFRIILPSTPRPFKWVPPFRFPHQIFLYISLVAYTYHTKTTDKLELCYKPMKWTECSVSL
jgi:hypothetical protein